MPRPMFFRSGLRRFGWDLATLSIAGFGAWLFAALGLPAAWLMGAMVATALAAVAGLPVELHRALREIAFLLLGISIGSSVTPGIVREIAAWPGSVVILLASIGATMGVSSLYLQRVHGWDRTTARFASMPGAFSSVAIIAANSSADLPRVILAQSLRVFTLVALMPPILSLLNGGLQAEGAALPPRPVNSPPEALAVFLASGAAAALLNRLHVPAGTLLAAMTISATLHASGLVHGGFPQPLVILGFIATGAVIGARFRGTTLQTVTQTVPGAAVSILLALAVSALFAAGGAWALDLPFGQLWLAYAPGGVEAMAAMALVLNLEPAFVGAHHILRILGLNLVSPLWFRNTGRGG
ncbi:AbrB family transcriptional regulator [Paracoccus sp. MC1854]|uniref:AbrB family transcriptional regulator n=1 Tax=Paracoccus sp. MC1854 TaxID=2760306 RepID=UPI001C719813|nr:AbrB family transcriptional regulator [Paracoccus sp. MC1854]